MAGRRSKNTDDFYKNPFWEILVGIFDYRLFLLESAVEATE